MKSLLSRIEEDGYLPCGEDSSSPCKGTCESCPVCYRGVEGDLFVSSCGHPVLCLIRHQEYLDQLNARLFRCEGCSKPVFYDVYQEESQ